MASRCLDPQDRTDFYKELETVGLWDAFVVPFESKTPEICFLTANVLSISMSLNTALLRQWMFQQEDNEREDTIIHKIANLLADRQRLFEMGEVSIVNTLFDILRLFIDTETAFDAGEKEALLRMIYYHPGPGIMQCLKVPFDAVPSFRGMTSGEMCEIEASLYGQTCDLLKYCVEAHSQRLRTFALRTNIFTSIFKILECRVSHVLLAGIRLLRTLIQRQDIFFDKLIINQQFIKPVVDILMRTGDRYNVLNSAAIELFECIRADKREKLKTHVISCFSNELKGIEYVSTFSQLLSPPPLPVHSPPREEMFDSADLLGTVFLPMNEEDYFNESDDEDSIHLTGAEELDSSSFKPKQSFFFEEDKNFQKSDASSSSSPPLPTLSPTKNLLSSFGEDAEGEKEKEKEEKDETEEEGMNGVREKEERAEEGNGAVDFAMQNGIHADVVMEVDGDID
eukprot:CAMPEP_0201510274 /NCGR_PEP_ID=MMETSP0161_2-20130828/3032_1 /ASSEMBLY_ACC=CAM_ASM_000251 /TAXON_ID=180227 /ORGANISM="Neoparamoeba aestuarina, Strain SoJaBio B1-5/56/2" /LENGTH=453 /DNA_ID=CAMNT_0047905423 /DNA_START=504 /DNA_END=1862 /DNA_ORIENTATION=-